MWIKYGANNVGYGTSICRMDGGSNPDPVAVAVTGVAVSPARLSLNLGQISTLSATVSPANATNKNVSWSSSNASIASVSSSGEVRTVAVGSCSITVTTQDGSRTAMANVTVTTNPNPVAVTGLTVSPARLSLSPGQTSTLSTTVSPSNATNKNVSWSSSNTAIATVSASGAVKAVTNGSCSITASTQDGAKQAVSNVVVATQPDPTPGEYCPSRGDASKMFIQSVKVGTVDNVSGSSKGYGDFTKQSVNLAKGSSQTIYLTPGYNGATSTVRWRVWVDYNGNGSFDDQNELIATGYSLNRVLEMPLRVSAAATSRTTRMRIAMVDYNEGNPSSCGTHASGEVEDYTVVISNK